MKNQENVINVAQTYLLLAMHILMFTMGILLLKKIHSLDVHLWKIVYYIPTIAISLLVIAFLATKKIFKKDSFLIFVFLSFLSGLSFFLFFFDNGLTDFVLKSLFIISLTFLATGFFTFINFFYPKGFSNLFITLVGIVVVFFACWLNFLAGISAFLALILVVFTSFIGFDLDKYQENNTSSISQNAFRLFFLFLGILWLFFIVCYYFKNHPEYFGSNSESVKVVSALKTMPFILNLLESFLDLPNLRSYLAPHYIGTFLVSVFVLYLFFVLYQFGLKDRKKIKITWMTPFLVLAFFSVFLLIFIDYWFIAVKYIKNINYIELYGLEAAEKLSLVQAFQKTSFITANKSIITKLSTIYLTLFTLTLFSFAFGKKILNITNSNTEENNKLGNSMLSIGLGLGVIMFIVFVLGLFGQITVLNLLILMALSLVLVYKETIAFLKRFFLEKFTFEANFFSFKILFLFSLSFILALNAIDLIRPMPIGWDDMGVYLNYPKQIAGIQSLLAGSTNNYFLIASLPFTFIKNEYLAAMNGMFISYWGGVLMLFALIAFVKRFLKAKYALMVAALIYIIPMTMHQSYADMKTDMTLFFFMILSVYAFLTWFQIDHTDKLEATVKATEKNKKSTKTVIKKEQNSPYKWLILAGIFAGIALGIKQTAILLIFGILIGIFYRLWGYKGAIGVFLLTWIPLNLSNALRIAKEFSDTQVQIATIILCILAAIAFFFANSQNKKLETILLSSLIFVSFTGIAFSPWALKNLNENNYKVSISSILNGKNKEQPTFDNKRAGVDGKTCKGTARTEELDRYLGYDKGIMRYLSLPWKVTMNTTVHGFYLDLSFLFLSFAPLGLIVFLLRRKEYNKQTQKIWQVLFLMGGASWIMWLFVGNGVIWYGIFGFILLVPLTAYFFYENHTTSLKITAGVLVITSVITVTAFRGTKFGNHTTIKYAYGIKNGLETVDSIVPNYRQIACISTGGTWNETAKTCKESESKDFDPIYRIGTFIAYFIPDNNRRIFNDPQLDKFKCIDDAFGNNDLTTMQKLKEQGYKYFILDLNTATIEKDPNGSLHKKANRFVEWVNNLNKQKKMYVHIYNKQKGIAFMEITDEKPIEEN